jgi:hypothetical protein
MWRAIVAVWHSGDEICPPEGGGLNLTLGKSIDEYQAFLKTLGYSLRAKAAYGKKIQ